MQRLGHAQQVDAETVPLVQRTRTIVARKHRQRQVAAVMPAVALRAAAA